MLGLGCLRVGAGPRVCFLVLGGIWWGMCCTGLRGWDLGFRFQRFGCRAWQERFRVEGLSN